jgi:phosphoesterase RecJ-like protein
MSITKIAKAIKSNKSFLIAAHINPDGDALGSQLALGMALRKLKKKVYLYAQESIPEIYDFLPEINKIRVFKKSEKINFDIAFVIDSPTLDRIGRLTQLIEQQPKIYIDHHPGPKHKDSLEIRDVKAAATAEIIYRLLDKLKVKIDSKIATCLYAGITTDTGFFRHPNTTSESLLISAELINLGAKLHLVSKGVNQSYSLKRLKLLGYGLKNIKLSHRGEIALMKIDAKTLKKTQTKPSDTEEFINYPKSIRSVRVAVLLREIAKNKIKVSLRSTDKTDVNAIASKFDGGGHRQASGCLIKTSLNAAEKLIVKEIIKSLK